jgi:hypothetical protein
MLVKILNAMVSIGYGSFGLLWKDIRLQNWRTYLALVLIFSALGAEIRAGYGVRPDRSLKESR